MRFQSCNILRKQFQELQRADGISLRSWSEAVDLSPAYVSLVLNSKRLPNLETLHKLGVNLDMDKLALAELKEAYQADWLKKNNIRAVMVKKAKNPVEEEPEFDITLMDDTTIFKSWLNLALAEFTTCDGFTEDPLRLARLFEVTPQDVRQALQWLTASGFLVRDEKGMLKKKFNRVRFPTSHRSRQHIRAFQKQMMLKAIKHMETHTAQEIFSKRLINGYTVAANPANVEKAQVMFQKAMQEIVQVLAEGECTEVYQVQGQLFPLLIKKD